MSLASIAAVRPAVGGGAKPHSFEVLQYRNSNDKRGNSKIGVPSSSRLGSRFAGSAWSSVTNGRAVHWIFGGWSLDGNGTQGYTNDMWSYASG